MLAELVDNLLDGPTHAGQMPDHLLKLFTALALRRAVLDQVAEIVRLRSGVIEIERINGRIRCRLLVKPRTSVSR